MMATLVFGICMIITTWIICTTVLTFHQRDELGRRKYGSGH